MLDRLTRFQKPDFWLISLGVAMAVLHLTLLNRDASIDSQNLWATCLLLWFVVGTLVWERRSTLTLQSGWGASSVGAALLGLLLLVSTAPAPSGTFLRAFPLLTIVSLGLLASGVRQLRQYWKELLIFGLLNLNPLLELGLELINLPNLTAKAATFMLWYTGFDVQREGLSLLLPTGRVDVYGPCSGIHNMLQMFYIAVLFLLMFPLRSPLQRLICVAIAVLLGFVVNAARVALMAILVAFSQKSAFEYWHTGNGSLIFSAIAVLLFGGFCWWAFLRHTQPFSNAGTPSDG